MATTDFNRLFGSPLGMPLGHIESFEGPEYKQSLISQKIQYMFDRTQSMFEYSGMGEGMPPDIFELYLQTVGFIGVIDVAGTLYATRGTLGGIPNEFNRPSTFIVANPGLQRKYPYIQINREYQIGVDCVVIKNDSLYIGLYPAFNHFANMLAENEITMHIDSINRRIVDLITADNDNNFKSAQIYLDDIKNGKLGSIADPHIFDGIKVQPYGNSARGTELVEIEQYWLAQLYNFIGLNANYNMKREAIGAGETALNDDSLTPLIENMLQCRKEGLAEIEQMFGSVINVRLSGSWAERDIMNDSEIEKAEAEADQAEAEADQAEEVDQPEEDQADSDPDDSDDEEVEENDV